VSDFQRQLDSNTPAMWSVLTNDGSVITAFNSVTKEYFSGTAAEFAARFKKPEVGVPDPEGFITKEQAHLLSRLLNSGIDVDPEGRILATVAQRTGTLSSLKQLAGLNGEVSVATDAPALVLHNAVAGQARTLMHPWGTKLVEATVQTSGRPVQSGVSYTVTNMTEVFDPLNVFNPTTSQCTLPAPLIATLKSVTVRVFGLIEERAGVGTVRRVNALSRVVHYSSGDEASERNGFFSAHRTFLLGPEDWNEAPNNMDLGGVVSVFQDTGGSSNLAMHFEVWGEPL
jgi:hypothetical protein